MAIYPKDSRTQLEVATINSFLFMFVQSHFRNPNTDGKGVYAEKSWPAHTKKQGNVLYLSAKEITNNKTKTRQKYCQALSTIVPFLCESVVSILSHAMFSYIMFCF